MSFELENAILHIIDNNSGKVSISNTELDIDSEICYEFINKHIKKLFNNTSVKEARFDNNSVVGDKISELKSGKTSFKDACIVIGERLSEIMLKNVDIPAADLLIAQFSIKKERHLAILKLNIQEVYTHKMKDTGSENQIVKYTSALPFGSGKVDEACIIPFDPLMVKLLEKSYLVDNEPTNYFSELFLECATELSKKEIVAIINELTEEVNGKYYSSDITVGATVKSALIDEAEEDEGVISIINVANKAFGDNQEAREDFINQAKDAGLKSETELGDRFVKQQFGNHRIKAENGVEIKIPSQLFTDGESIEFIRLEDGTQTIMLKNLGSIEAKQ